jgi:cell division protease FtsH
MIYMKLLFKNFFIYLFIFVLLAALFSSFSGLAEKKASETVGLDYLPTKINAGEVAAIDAQGNKLTVHLNSGESKIITKEANVSLPELLQSLNVDSEKLSGVKLEIKAESGSAFWLKSILPILLPFILIAVFFFFMFKGVSGANSKAMMFGQSQIKEFKKNPKIKVSFKDVAGAKEAKEELREVVDFLRFPKKFQDLGARIPKGILLLGSPGTGKTLMARSVAGEANVPFFHISGSEFVEMFVGVGASRVRSLFAQAKKAAPCIIFIDEIDAVGRKRGSGMGGSHDEREQTLNQILVEMDGFEGNTGVIVLAATNRPDVLDPALLRPGRFDRQVVIDKPDLSDREEILKVHARKKPLGKNANLKLIAERTPGFSGADLENVLNEAAILSARQDKKTIDNETILMSIEKVMMGPERRGRVISDREKKITAYHETGHAIVAHFLPGTDAVHKVSIISRGQAAGYTLKLPDHDRNFHSKEEFINELAVLLAGHLTEKKIFGDVTTGATSDLRRATALARSLITDYGMSENLGPRTFGQKEEMIFLGREIHEQRDYSEKIAEKIDEEITNFLALAESRAKEILNSHSAEMEKVALELLAVETLEKEAFEALVGPKLTN